MYKNLVYSTPMFNKNPMLPKSNSSLVPSSNTYKNNFYKQTLSPNYLVFDSHYQSTPNVAFYFDDQVRLIINDIYIYIYI